MTGKYMFGLCLMGLLLAVAHPVAAQAPAPVQVRLAPQNLQAPLDGFAQVAVEVVEVQDLYGVDLRLLYDPVVVEILDADPDMAGVQMAMGVFLDPGFVIHNEADNAAGAARFSMTQLNPSPAKNGSGVLLVITLRGKKLGAQSSLTLEKVQLGTRTGLEIPAQAVSGVVTVVQSLSGPTATLIPTRGAGTPFPDADTLATLKATRAATATSTTRPSSSKASTSTPSPLLAQATATQRATVTRLLTTAPTQPTSLSTSTAASQADIGSAHPATPPMDLSPQGLYPEGGAGGEQDQPLAKAAGSSGRAGGVAGSSTWSLLVVGLGGGALGFALAYLFNRRKGR